MGRCGTHHSPAVAVHKPPSCQRNSSSNSRSCPLTMHCRQPLWPAHGRAEQTDAVQRVCGTGAAGPAKASPAQLTAGKRAGAAVSSQAFEANTARRQGRACDHLSAPAGACVAARVVGARTWQAARPYASPTPAASQHRKTHGRESRVLSREELLPSAGAAQTPPRGAPRLTCAAWLPLQQRKATRHSNSRLCKLPRPR